MEVAYGAVRALKGVSLEVREGEVVTLLGANGAGKSTILRAISGLVRPRAGNITFQGETLSRLTPAQVVRRGIGHCPEGRRVFAGLSVQDNLVLGASGRADREVESDIRSSMPSLSVASTRW